MSTFDGLCPHCGKPVQVNSETHELSKKNKSSNETFADALKKLNAEKKARKDQFEKKQKDLNDQKKKSDKVFKDNLDSIKEKGLGEKPIRDIDL
ncbi:MAG: hypothetical protein GF384_04560 [Elusimicrobia bacterium]|nr:hypothetical protein [Elusimicrobiota bacterium]MBD3412116.1 hypothetical protein [Elusimicrobiota bacterium]